LAATVAQALKKPALPTLPAADHLPDIALAAVKNMLVRQMYFPKAGQREDGHSHPIDHMTLLARGALTVIVNGISTDFCASNGGKIIYIKAGVEHTLIAREDGTLAFCIHALREDNETEDIIDPESIPDGVNAVRAGLAAPLICDQTVHGRGGRVPLVVAYR
jgi:quercetin dioxygenase-like cupin family protein